MKTRPILFSGPMVRALLEGRKTQTRRVGKIQGAHYVELGVEGAVHATRGDILQATYASFPGKGTARWAICECLYGIPGDRLWVRETWSHTGEAVWVVSDARARGKGGVIYRATDKEPLPGCWWPSIHMPREFSRITLEIVSVRVERLNQISEDDAKAEGVTPRKYLDANPFQTGIHTATFVGGSQQSSYQAFKDLWESINGVDSWQANPWVWVMEFKALPK